VKPSVDRFATRHVFLAGIALGSVFAGLTLGVWNGNLLGGRDGSREVAAQLVQERADSRERPVSKSSGEAVEGEHSLAQFKRWLYSIPPGTALTELTPELSARLARVSKDELPRVLEWTAGVERGDLKRLLLVLLMDRWPVRQRDEALAMAGLMPDSRSARSTLIALLEHRSESDWEGAARWVRRVSDDGLRRRGAEAVLLVLAAREPEQAMEWIETFNLKGGVAGVREGVFRRWLLSTPERALAWWLRPSETLEPVERSRLLASAVDLESELPVTAAGKVRALSYFDSKREVPESVKAWTRMDGPGAWRWTSTIPDFYSRENAQLAVLAGWASSDLRGALAWTATKLDTDGEMLQLAKMFVTFLGAESFDAAVDWTRKIQNAAQRNTIFRQLVESVAERNPQAAAEWLSKQSDPSLVEAAMGDVVGHWSRKDPTSAAKWVEAFPEGKMRDEAWHTVARQWTFEGHDQAIAWIDALPPGSGRDKALEAYVESVDGSRPDLAALWALEIDSPIDRERWLVHAAGRWIQKDRHAAMEWIEQADLPEDVKGRLLPRER